MKVTKSPTALAYTQYTSRLTFLVSKVSPLMRSPPPPTLMKGVEKSGF